MPSKSWREFSHMALPAVNIAAICGRLARHISASTRLHRTLQQRFSHHF
jgi:hypothetical protein